MKIRNGFVSNSSSSSFIVVFDRKPESIEDVEKQLNLGRGVVFCDSFLTASEVATIVFSDINYNTVDQDFIECLENLFAEFLNAYAPTRNVFYCSGYNELVNSQVAKYVPESSKSLLDEYWKAKSECAKLDISLYGNCSEEKRKSLWEKYDKVSELSWDLAQKLAKESVKDFLKKNEGKFIFVTEYRDNDGPSQATMEHGNVFRNLENIQISHH